MRTARDTSVETRDTTSKEVIAVHTVPSQMVTFGFPTTKKPYQRILRITTPDGTSREEKAIDKHEGKLNERTLPMTPELTARLVSFFDEYLSKRMPFQCAYNCHRFALWMNGIRPPYPSHADERSLAATESVANQVVNRGERHDSPLSLGEMGVIGYRMNGPNAIHSLLGLGEDSPECLQVTGADGYLAIDTYANRMIEAMRGEHTPDSFGLYSAANLAQ